MSKILLPLREQERKKQFGFVWAHHLNDAFADIAPYYDRGNQIASLGLWQSFLRGFMQTIEVRADEKVLDICAGTHAVGIALLHREPTLEVYGLDRSAEMLEVGRKNAATNGLKIHGLVGDAHQLPFPDKHFDVVTLQFASRHLRVGEVFGEVLRVLKPGGRFHHCDMLRPANPLIRGLYFSYLKACLTFTSVLVGSGPDATRFKQYFVDALELFYTPVELAALMREYEFDQVAHQEVFEGIIGFHRGTRPARSQAPPPQQC